MTRIAPLAAAALLLAAGLPLTVTVAPALAQDVDLDAIFDCSPEGPLGTQTVAECEAARTLILNNCTSCHTFVPIVKAQKPDEAWTSLLEVHRDRVPQLSDAEFEALGAFLRAHFNETEPVPELPPALEALGSNLPA